MQVRDFVPTQWVRFAHRPETTPEVVVKRTGESKWVVTWRDVTYAMTIGFKFGPEFAVVSPAVIAVDAQVIAQRMIAAAHGKTSDKERRALVAALDEQLPGTITIGGTS